MIGPPVLRRRILKGSGQPDRERAAVLMEGGGNAFMSYMNFGDEQDRSSFPTDDLAAASPAGSSCTRAPTAATAARASTAAAAAAAAAAATAATGRLTTGGEGRLAVRAA